MFLKINVVTNESRYSIKVKYILLILFKTNIFLGYHSPITIRKQPQRRTIKPRRRKVLPTYTIPHINTTIKKVITRTIARKFEL